MEDYVHLQCPCWPWNSPTVVVESIITKLKRTVRHSGGEPNRSPEAGRTAGEVVLSTRNPADRWTTVQFTAVSPQDNRSAPPQHMMIETNDRLLQEHALNTTLLLQCSRVPTLHDQCMHGRQQPT